VAYYDNPGQVNDEAISVAGGKTFQVIQVADSSGNIIDPAGGQIVIEGDVIVSEVEISNDVGHPIPVNDAGGSLTVDGPLTDAELRATALPVSGPLTDAELRATALPVSAAALPLPTGAATEAKQDTLIGHVDGVEALLTTIDAGTGSIDGKLPALSGGKVPVVGPLTDTELRATALPVSGPLTDTELRATALPVSGPLTDTELRATAVPVSAAALPLPTGAATEAKQDTGNTSLGNIDTDLGAPADAAASSDTGTFGLIALIKRGLQNWTTLLGRVPANLTVTSTRLLVDGSGVTQPVELPYLVSTENSKTTGGLTPNENWNASGTGDEILQYGTVTVCVFSDQNSATSGLVFEASLDGVNWQTMEAYTYKTTEGFESFSMAPSGRYFRVRFVNGTVASTVTRIQTIYRQGYTKSSSHRIGDIISAEKDAELVKAVLAAEKPNLDFVDIRATAGGNLKISLEEINGVDPIPTSVPTRTPTTTSIASSATSVTIRGANANRKGISVHNLSTATLYLSFTTPATTTNSFIAMSPGSFLLLDQQLIVSNAIYGIWFAANGTAQVTEYV
jgi:hypothetical protein